jgi:hypothetical protein
MNHTTTPLNESINLSHASFDKDQRKRRTMIDITIAKANLIGCMIAAERKTRLSSFNPSNLQTQSDWNNYRLTKVPNRQANESVFIQPQ